MKEPCIRCGATNTEKFMVRNPYCVDYTACMSRLEEKTVEKKFKDMTILEKAIHNEQSIIDMTSEAIDILVSYNSPYIPICTLRADIEKREKWLQKLKSYM